MHSKMVLKVLHLGFKKKVLKDPQNEFRFNWGLGEGPQGSTLGIQGEGPQGSTIGIQGEGPEGFTIEI